MMFLKKRGTVVISVFLLVLSAGGNLEAQKVVDYGPKLFRPTEEVVTPHICWAKPYYGEPLKVLFITYTYGMREIIELTQRMSLDYEVSGIGRRREFGISGENRSIKGGSAEECKQDLTNKLSSNYDLIVIGNIKWDELPLICRAQILKKVKEGTGLVAYVPIGRDEYFNKVLSKKIPVKNIISAFPFSLLSAFSKYPDFNTFLRNTLKVYQFGEGRVILLDNITVPEKQMLTPGAKRPLLETKLLDYDYYLSLIIQSFFYVSRKEPFVRIVQPEASSIEINRDNLKEIGFLLESGKKRKVSLNFILRNRDNVILESKEKAVSLSKGNNKVTFSLPNKLPAGSYFADLFVKEKEKIINFGSLSLKVNSDTFIRHILLPKESFSRKEPIRGKVIIFNPTGKENLLIRQFDNYSRLVNEIIFPIEGGMYKKITFKLPPLSSPLSALQRIEISLLDNNKETLSIKNKVFTLNDLYPPADEMRCLIWGTGLWGNSFLDYYLCQELYKNGIDTNYPIICEWAVRANLHHCCIAGRPEPTKMPLKDNIRVPCFTDPKYLDRFKKELIERTKQIAEKYPVFEFSLGDEMEITPRGTSYELCFSPTCIKTFQESLKKEYKNIEKLNQEYSTDYKDFSEVKPATLRQVKENSSLLPSFIDHCLSMDSVWAGINSFGRKAIREVVPEARVGYEGSDVFIRSYRHADYYKLRTPDIGS